MKKIISIAVLYLGAFLLVYAEENQKLPDMPGVASSSIKSLDNALKKAADTLVKISNLPSIENPQKISKRTMDKARVDSAAVMKTLYSFKDLLDEMSPTQKEKWCENFKKAGDIYIRTFLSNKRVGYRDGLNAYNAAVLVLKYAGTQDSTFNTYEQMGKRIVDVSRDHKDRKKGQLW